ncbi:hypothetical protein [Sphingomonas koreensis]
MNDQVDMSRFIEAKSDQLNADDLIGNPRTITITRVAGCEGDQPIAIYYDGDNGKPFKPCKTIRRVLMGVWGRYANEYAGRSMTLYRDDSVTFGGLQVGGIRISHMSGLEKETTVVVMKSKGKKAGMKILPLKDAPRQQQTAELTLDQARAALDEAGTLDELKTAWQRKPMAPHRDALKQHLEARKSALSAEGPSDDQRGDAHDGTAADHPARGKCDDWISRCDGANHLDVIEQVEREFAEHRDALPEELVSAVQTAIETNRTRIDF